MSRDKMCRRRPYELGQYRIDFADVDVVTTFAFVRQVMSVTMFDVFVFHTNCDRSVNTQVPADES